MQRDFNHLAAEERKNCRRFIKIRERNAAHGTALLCGGAVLFILHAGKSSPIFYPIALVFLAPKLPEERADGSFTPSFKRLFQPAKLR